VTPLTGRAWWRGTLAGPLVAVVTVIAAVIATRAVGLPVRDPDHVAALYLALVGFGVLVLVGIDIVLRARAREGRFPPTREAMRTVRAERWTARRGAAAAIALVGFYVTYMAYRNLKSVVPLLRPGDLFDRQLAELDRSMLGGHEPAALLHSLLGTGLITQVLSAAYVAFIVFLPLTIGIALVFARDLQAGLFYTTAQSVNWLLGAGSYFLLPSLGPIYAEPSAFAGLPHSEAARLQGVLLDQRLDFLRDPGAATPQSIAAFASLHISMSFTAVVAAHLLGAGRRLRTGLWIWFAVTALDTIYLGWHYVLDDVGGLALGALALVLAGVLTGIDPRTARQPRRTAGARGRTGWDGDEVAHASAGGGRLVD
jgi:membrane-associated phospholipid phosphatase